MAHCFQSIEEEHRENRYSEHELKDRESLFCEKCFWKQKIYYFVSHCDFLKSRINGENIALPIDIPVGNDPNFFGPITNI